MSQETSTGTSGLAKSPSVSAPPDFKLPEIMNAATMLADTSIVLPEEIIPGILHRGLKGVLGGSSKAGKTWSMVDLAVSVASGVDWWGWPTKRGRVLYINFEIPQPFFRTRVQSICKKKNVTDISQLDVWTLRGHADKLKNLLREVIARIKESNYVLVIIDPIYKGLGGRDENAAGDISELCNELERIAVECNVAVFYAAHYSKGNQAGKEAIDRIAGSGVWTRDADTIITVTKHKDEQDDAFTVDMILRNVAPKDPFVISLDFPIMKLRPDLDPNDLKQKAGRPNDHTPEQVLELLESGSMTTTQWAKRAKEEGISTATFHRLKKSLVGQSRVAQDLPAKTWVKAEVSQLS